MNIEEMTVETHQLETGPDVPNHPRWPLLLYRGAFDPDTVSPSTIEERFRDNGWTGTWRNGIYSFHHYHTTAHEVLGIASGMATVTFGGAEGITVELSPGNVAVLPAGTGHRNEGSSSDLLVVGAYPRGQTSWDLRRADELQVEDAHDRIRKVPAPGTDPIFGREGPLLEHWNP